MITVKQSISLARPISVVVNGENHFITLDEAARLNEQLVSVIIAIHNRL